MDSLTHLVAGALTPLAFRATPKRAAVVAFGITVGELPDIDIFFGGSVESLLTLHRGITHALVWQPLLVLVAVVPFYIWLYCRQVPIRTGAVPVPCEPGFHAGEPGKFSLGHMYILALIATCTHIYLDCMTTFGTQALLPFSEVRVNFPAMFIVDLLLTLPALALLGAALLQPALLSYRPQGGAYAFFSTRSVRLARIGLGWILCYPLFALGVNAVTTSWVADRPLATAGTVQQVKGATRLLTEPFSPFVWKAIVDEGTAWRMHTLYLAGGPDTPEIVRYAKPDKILYESLKKQHPLFRQFEDFSPTMVQLENVPPPRENALYGNSLREYAFVDLRYMMSPNSPARWIGRDDANFILEARVNGSGALVAYRFLERGKADSIEWTFVQ